MNACLNWVFHDVYLLWLLECLSVGKDTNWFLQLSYDLLLRWKTHDVVSRWVSCRTVYMNFALINCMHVWTHVCCFQVQISSDLLLEWAKHNVVFSGRWCMYAGLYFWYVCMFVCMYLCIYLCMQEWLGMFEQVKYVSSELVKILCYLWRNVWG